MQGPGTFFSTEVPTDVLEKLAVLHEQGILTEEEFRAKKEDILRRI